MRAARGFTLIELVITIAVSAIVLSFMAMFIAGPVRGYTDQVRRADLIDIAENTLRRVARDIRRALPNSVRLTSAGPVVALEMLATTDGVRYRLGPPPSDPDKQLDFAAAEDAFNSVGTFGGISKPFSSTTHYLSIYNVGVPGADAYELANVITPPGTRIDIDTDTIPGEDNVRLSPAFQFAFGSPAQRVFLVAGPVTYLCDALLGTLVRYEGYDIASSQADRDSDAELLGAGAVSTLIADQVSACNMTYTSGTAQRAGLATLELGVSDAGETVSLLHQVHVDNVP
jgi:MSHA biogenesis protein MshO